MYLLKPMGRTVDNTQLYFYVLYGIDGKTKAPASISLRWLDRISKDGTRAYCPFVPL